MNPRPVALAVLAAALVAAVLGGIWFEAYGPAVRTTTTTFTAVVPTTVTIVGTENRTVTVTTGVALMTCVATSFFLPDTIQEHTTTVTQTVGSTTTTYTSLVVDYPHTSSYGPYYYTAAANSSESAGYVTTATQNQDLSPSAGWTVATCTYLP